MTKRTLWIIIIVASATIAVAAGIVYWCSQPRLFIDRLGKADETNKVVYAEAERVANPLIVGKWYVEKHLTSFKAYYDDPCEQEGYFWGKEWNEEEDVMEEDLEYHGNGWFQWCKKGNQLMELHMSTNGAFVVPMTYDIATLTKDRLELKQAGGILVYLSTTSTMEE